MIRVFEYGAHAPKVNGDVVHEQMSLAHRYYNRLIEAQRARIEAERDILSSHADVAELERAAIAVGSEFEEVLAEIRDRRKAARKTNDDKGLRARAKELRRKKKEAWAVVRAAKKLLREDEGIQAEIAAVRERAKVWTKALRAQSGLYWGTYLGVEQAVEDAVKKCQDLPRFKRWTGLGHLSVQFQKGLDVEDLLHGADRRGQLDAVNAEAFVRSHSASAPGEGRRPKQRTELRLRVQSAGRDPVFAHMDVIYHRPLPPGRVKWAHLIRVPVADKYRWKVQFNVELDEDADKTPQTRSDKSAGIDVGWRLLESGDLRVAYLYDSDGRREELRLPARLLQKAAHTDALRSERDMLFDGIKGKILEWLEASTGHPDLPLPHHVRLWRSQGRVVRLLEAHGDTMPLELQDAIEQWRREDVRLWRWEHFERRKIILQRRELYRLWCVDVTQRYGRLVLEKFDLSKMARRAADEDDTKDSRKMFHLRTIACVSSLRDNLKQAAQKRGVLYYEVNPAFTTLACHACTHIDEDWNPATSLVHACSHCGAEWDQDENAARNLLASDSAASPEAQALAGSNSPAKQRFSARQRRLRGIGEDADRGARESATNA